MTRQLKERIGLAIVFVAVALMVSTTLHRFFKSKVEQSQAREHLVIKCADCPKDR